jgi:hypothetical protein
MRNTSHYGIINEGAPDRDPVMTAFIAAVMSSASVLTRNGRLGWWVIGEIRVAL